MPKIIPASLSLLRYAWTLPNTLVGGAFIPVALLSGGSVRRVRGVLEVHGRAVAWLLARMPGVGGASALTLGHVVLGQDEAALSRCRAHEKVHVEQYERWGPLFVPAYLTASLLALARGGNAYLDNYFEREARRRAGS